MAALALLAAALAPAGAPAADPPGRLCSEAMVPMDDGVRLHARISRPAPDRARPVLLMVDSYARTGRPGRPGTRDGACPEVLPDEYVPNFLSTSVIGRFTLVQVSLRGTGASEGRFDLMGPRSQADTRAAVRWAAAQPWSTGAITLVGESGTAFAAFHALREPAVRAAVLFSTCADLYDCFHRGGIPNGLSAVYLGGTRAGLRGPEMAERAAALDALAAEIAAHPRRDAWWQARSALDGLRDVDVPVLLTTDPWDIVSPFDAAARIPGVRLNLGMGHVTATAGMTLSRRFARLVRGPVDRFVARFGLGERGVPEDPPVTLVSAVGRDLVVRGERAWPPPGTRTARLALAPAAIPYGNALPDLRATSWIAGRPEPATGHAWTWGPLRRDLELAGPVMLRLRAGAAADWTARLERVAPDGTATWLTDGRLRAGGGARTIALEPAFAIARRGGRLRLTLHAACPPGPGGCPAGPVAIAGARLALPVAGGSCDRGRAIGASVRLRCARTLGEALR